MADNYLEKRYAEINSGGGRTAYSNPSIDTLLARNRSVRGYRKDNVVKIQQLERIIAVNTKVASARNRQALRFRPVTQGPEADAILKSVVMGAGLPELHLPLPGTEPEAFILVASSAEEDQNLFIDLGISLQSMLLKAVSMGLNGLIIRAFNREGIEKALEIPKDMRLLCVLAIGKSGEKVDTVPVDSGMSLAYYRDAEGTHHVPKVKAEDLLF
ncbi:MAG: nitroreductase family protein [Bacteroidales bacterium]|nr:nitroreductase family protein [Candidatus Cryptobacteroides faecihippi]